jgi:thiamine-phosphate pyrophosphorylase
MKKIGRLHVITDTVLQSRFDHVELAGLAVAGGADTIQYRQKTGSTREMIETACCMKRLCAEAGVAFIVNDRLDVALASEADGVHLGREDFPIPLARRLLGKNLVIGGSAASLEEACKCAEEGADYIGFGPVYPTGSKADAAPATGIPTLKQVLERVSVPVIAIGGINPDNTRELIAAGARGVAVISSVCCREDPAAATKALRQAIWPESGGGHG